MIEDKVQHNAVERSLLQKEVHADGSIVTDIKLADLKEPTTVPEATD